VNNLLKQYGQAKKMMKSLTGSMGDMGSMGKKLARMGLGKGFPGLR